MTDTEITALRLKITDQSYIHAAIETLACDLVAGRVKFVENPILEDSKKCTLCGEVKPVSEFYGHSGGWLIPWCKQCMRQRNKQNRLKIKAKD